MSYVPYVGPVYSLLDGLKLHDIDAGCPNCGKRLAEVVNDPTWQWNRGQIVCIDCGQTVRLPRTPTIRIRPSWRASGLYLAGCTCGWYSMPVAKAKAEEFGANHLATHVPDVA